MQPTWTLDGRSIWDSNVQEMGRGEGGTKLKTRYVAVDVARE